MRTGKHRPEKWKPVFGSADAHGEASARKVETGFRISRAIEPAGGHV